MADINIDFDSIANNNPERTMFGHGTLVQLHKTPIGHIIKKVHRTDGKYVDSFDAWLAKAKTAKSVTDKICALNNPAYFVPQTYIVNDNVYEDFVHGTPVSELSNEYIEQNKDWIIPAVANLINDLSELEPIKTSDDNVIPAVQVINLAEVSDILAKRRDLISGADAELVKSVYAYLLNLPEGSELVYSHNDFNRGNVLIDTENHRVSFIDFEVAGYNTKLHIMYQHHFLDSISGVWDYINTNLKRTKNKRLVWNHNETVRYLYNFVFETVFDIIENNTDDIKQIPSRCAQVRQFVKEQNITLN